jgi:hypothetical protein
LDDFTNDLTAREQLQRVLDVAPVQSLRVIRRTLRELDDVFVRFTVPVSEPLFAADVAKGDPAKYFFYYRVPKAPGTEMIEDLIRMKFIRSRSDLRN